MDAIKIIGGNGKRREMDFYPTPWEVTKVLIGFLMDRYLLWTGDTVWECAAGEGHMADVIAESGMIVSRTDIQTGTDFLTFKMAPRDDIRWIITNPPFSQAEAFIKRAMDWGLPFAFLLKSQYWHSARRLPLFEETKPAYVCPLTWRPDFTGQGNSLMDMVWVVWLPGNTEPTRYIPLRRPGK